MPPKYQDYLASGLLSEGRIISYRILSRALKVHSNAAKEMLYDFHRNQNTRKPGSLHASYLISGVRKPPTSSQTNGANSQDGEAKMMHDTSFMSSSMPEQEIEVEKIPVVSITLAREEDLEAVKKLYETISGIHIYSLEPSSLNNIQILSDCNRKIASEYSSEDPLETWTQYGTIHNPIAKRRQGTRPLLPVVASQQPTTAAMKAIPKPVAAAGAQTTAGSKPTDREPPGRRDSTPEAKTSEPSKKPAGKAASLKRDSSSIFRSFAKAKSTLTTENSNSEASAAPSPAPSGPESAAEEDETMRDAPASDEEVEDDFVIIDQDADAGEKAEAARKAKSDREASLRKMMEDDNDEPMEDAEEGTTTHSPPLAPTPEAQNLQSQEEIEPQVTVTNGRRRGRRRVMKKKTTRDAEGYLVTREEAAWESFSEEEPAAKKAKAEVGKGGAGAGGAVGRKEEKKEEKGKGGGVIGGGKGKQGQGSIMNFFAKK